MYLVKESLKRCLLSAGLELKRIDRKPKPPLVYKRLQETLKRRNCGERVTYLCPVSKCVVVNGFSFSRANSWHPFVQAMKEYMESGFSRAYPGSLLELFYKTWQPENAREALIGARNGPAILSRYPAYAMHSPWLDIDPEERQSFMSKMISDENRWFGNDKIDASDGYGLHGPVSDRKGKLEYMRLTKVLNSVHKHGYNRLLAADDPTVMVIERDGDHRFCIAHGQHRVAVMAALGYEYLPVAIKSFSRASEMGHWPQVYRGVWSADETTPYIRHLFEFDSRNWAQKLGLTSDRQPRVVAKRMSKKVVSYS